MVASFTSPSNAGALYRQNSDINVRNPLSTYYCISHIFTVWYNIIHNIVIIYSLYYIISIKFQTNITVRNILYSETLISIIQYNIEM